VQYQLYNRYARPATAGIVQGRIITAVGRELLDFLWAIGTRRKPTASGIRWRNNEETIQRMENVIASEDRAARYQSRSLWGMVTIVLADNQPIYRAGIAKIVAMDEDIRIVAQCDDSESLMLAMEMFRRSIAVFSSSMEPNLPELIQVARATSCRLIVIAENEESLADHPNQAFCGLLRRNVDPIVLMECVRRVAAGETYLQRNPNGSIENEADAVGANLSNHLTAKELQIIALVMEACKNKDIARKLGTTEQTIKNCLCRIYDKANVADRLSLALLVTNHRLLAEAVARATSPNFCAIDASDALDVNPWIKQNNKLYTVRPRSNGGK